MRLDAWRVHRAPQSNHNTFWFTIFSIPSNKQLSLLVKCWCNFASGIWYQSFRGRGRPNFDILVCTHLSNNGCVAVSSWQTKNRMHFEAVRNSICTGLVSCGIYPGYITLYEQQGAHAQTPDINKHTQPFVRQTDWLFVHMSVSGRI